MHPLPPDLVVVIVAFVALLVPLAASAQPNNEPLAKVAPAGKPPYIIKDHLDLEAIRARKQREYDEFAGSFRVLDGLQLQPRIDYRRKRGLLEEINRTLQDIETDAAARAAFKPPASVKPGPVESAAPAPAAVDSTIP